VDSVVKLILDKGT
jgi:hypothetical protein